MNFRKMKFFVAAKHAGLGENDFLKSFSPKTNAPLVFFLFTMKMNNFFPTFYFLLKSRFHGGWCNDIMLVKVFNSCGLRSEFIIRNRLAFTMKNFPR